MAFRRPSRFAGFTTIWFGQLLSALGTRMTNFALSIWVWDATGRAFDLTLLMAFAFGSTVIFSPIAGALVDRWSRRLTVVLSDIGSAVTTGVLLLLFLTDSVQVWHLYLVNLVTGAFLAFQLPAYQATITVMMEKGQYPRANAMMFAVRTIPVIFAPGFAAALLGLMDIKTILLIDAISYLVAIGAVLLVKLPPVPRSTHDDGGFWSDTTHGFRYILASRAFTGLEAILFAINVLAAVGFALLVPQILARTDSSTNAVGLVQTIGAVGGVAGAGLLAVLPNTRHKIRRMLIAILVFSVLGRIIYGIGDTVIVWAIALLFLHLAIPFIDGYAQSVWQEKVEPAQQGRVFAARQFIEDLAYPGGTALAGIAADRWFEPMMRDGGPGVPLFGWLVGSGPGAGMGLIFVIVGVLGIGVAVAGFASPSIRRMEVDLPDYDEAAAGPAPLPAPTGTDELTDDRAVVAK
ncbi:MFS transporter [Micromonospora sp. 4G57]|uniref:MFS transporter n=1 Tax=Micromonospora sicca TaxID=2202420 RepID=A0ABU5J6N0_9ACTN|nr:MULTISPECIES: MFS transporter [unclassified Micromonospora]MDZ5443044.1 MFS transporter [Micromonospora sp. 4G57]MDZ5488244.1 MFS transporter [Micromonospora sp. 4G53]